MLRLVDEGINLAFLFPYYHKLLDFLLERFDALLVFPGRGGLRGKLDIGGDPTRTRVWHSHLKNPDVMRPFSPSPRSLDSRDYSKRCDQGASEFIEWDTESSVIRAQNLKVFSAAFHRLTGQ